MGSGKFTFKGKVMCCGKTTSVKGNIFKPTRSGNLEKNRMVRQDEFELHSILFQPLWMQNRMQKSPQPTLAIVPRTTGTMKKAADSYNCVPALFYCIGIFVRTNTPSPPLNVLRCPRTI